MMPKLPAVFASASRRLVTHDGNKLGTRDVPEETPIALTYDRTTYAVMMGTPADIEDFAMGFSLTERIIEDVGEIAELEIVTVPQGIEARMNLSSNRDVELVSRRRRLTGPAGCGLCGIESLEAAMAPLAHIESSARVSAGAIFRALGSMRDGQTLNAKTHAVHAAGFWSDDRLMALREDVGRHNALDKLAGALARAKIPAASGILVLSSRLSIELVQKAAAIGCPVIVAVSAPTALALRAADESGMTVVAVARDDSLEVFTHAERIGT
jgi:FdhD protein